MRWSQALIPTLKEVPQDAEIPSHRLLLRAGMIRKVAAGLYTFLPLGRRALLKVERIVREEMDRAGALEILMPALQPVHLWHESGRYEAMREVMFGFKDRRGGDLVLGPTHEEVVTTLAAGEIRSYRDLPRNLYQIQTKFRDEIRPRFGLMRSREFIMKDAYSFDADDEGAKASYEAMYEAYRRIFRRCGLDTRAVEADSGAMGGSSSHEFMVLADAGEDGLVECAACGYAANLEAARSRPAAAPAFEGADAAPEEVPTPGARTIEEVSAFLQAPPAQFVKSLVHVTADGPVLVLAAGDRDVHDVKLGHALGADARLADDDTVCEVAGVSAGFVGPVGLARPTRIVADEKLRGGRGLITGANREDAHLRNLDLARDVPDLEFADLTAARTGDHCPECGEALTERRGIEVGHVFRLGTKYSEALGATFLDAEGQTRPAIMGCYGIGVTRTLQAVVEQSHDKDGILWPVSVAPYEVSVLVLNRAHDPSRETAEAIVAGLEAAGVEVLYDDRDDRPGSKFKDADLVGIPVRIAVGERSLAAGEVELKLRRGGEVTRVPVERAVAAVGEQLEALRAELT